MTCGATSPTVSAAMKLKAISIDHPRAITIAPAKAVLASRAGPPSPTASVARHTPANQISATAEYAAMMEATTFCSSLSCQYSSTSPMRSFAPGVSPPTITAAIASATNNKPVSGA